MRNSFVLLVALLGMGFTAQAAETRIGYVNLAEVLQASPQAKAAEDKLTQEFAAERREILAQSEDLKKMQEKYQKDAATMGDSERTALERRMRDLQRDLQRRQQEFQEDVQIRRNEELGALQRTVVMAVQDYARTEGFDLIVVEGVAYASDAINVTAAVVERVKTAK